MVDLAPLRALRYSPDAGPLDALLAPPYDVVDAEQRAALLRADPHNVVALDLPDDPTGGDRYAYAASMLGGWTSERVLVRDEEPALWAHEQTTTGADGTTLTRTAVWGMLRLVPYGEGVRPHERTQPGPKADRLALLRATRHDLSPVFGLVDADVRGLLADHASGPPAMVATGPEGSHHRLWQVSDPAVHGEVATVLADAEVLVADGHHRYETARTYAQEVGGDGPHRRLLVALVGLEDPGLVVRPTHRLLTGLDDDAVGALLRGLGREFEVDPVPVAAADPTGLQGVGVLGLRLADGRAFRVRLRDPGAGARLLPGASGATRSLDPALVEAAVLSDLLGMSADDVAARRGLAYARGDADVDAALADGTADAALLLRATPVEQVRAVAAAGETMPPKSTFFTPKLPTGLLLAPLV